MTKKGRSTQSVVEKLVEQRRLIHDWLAKLRANVDGMPENVIDRVRKDYRTRLDTVMAELSSHRDTLRETLQEAQERQEDLEQVQQRRKDELAELKLRRQVGEMDDPHFKEEQSEMQGAIDQIKKDLANTIRDIERYEEILEVISAGESPTKDDEDDEPKASRREPEPETKRPAPKKDVDELAFLRSVTSVIGAVKLPPKPTAPPPPPPPPAPPPPRPVGPPPRPVESVFDAAPGLVQIPVEPIPPAPPDPEPSAAPVTHGPTSAATPSAASIPKSGSAAAETIKCKNCGAANKPTEWYCEKCGAEISAF